MLLAARLCLDWMGSLSALPQSQSQQWKLWVKGEGKEGGEKKASEKLGAITSAS